MKKRILFNPLGKRWNRFLKQFQNLYKRIMKGSGSEQQQIRLINKLNRVYKRLEKMQHRVGVKLAGTAIVIMMLSATGFAQNFTQLPNLTVTQGVDVWNSTPVFADIDGDNDLDLYVGEQNGNIKVFTNDGNSNFSDAGNLQANGSDIDVGSFSSPVFADIDDDSDLDLYVGEQNGNIKVFTNDGNGNFSDAGNLQANGSDIDAGEFASPVFADVDGDSDLDLYIGEKYGRIKNFINDGNGFFSANGYLQADDSNIDIGFYNSPVFADIDNDSDLDLYVGENDGIINIFLNDGNGNFSVDGNLQVDGSDIYVENFSTPTFADIDNDNDIDLYVGENSGNIKVFINNGSGNFSENGNLQVNGYVIDVEYHASPIFADLDGDNDLDLYVGENDGNINIFLNDGNGNFSANGNLQADDSDINAGYCASPVFADIDGDSDLDLYIGVYGNIKIFLNDGTGNFTANDYLQADGSNIDVGSDASPTFADIDGNNALDLYVGEYNGNIKVFINDGSGNFSAYGNLQADASDIDVGLRSTPAFADIDGDNDIDLYIGANEGNINVFLNDGNNNFSANGNLQADGSDIYAGYNAYPVFANTDGHLNLFVGNSDGNILVYQGAEVVNLKEISKTDISIYPNPTTGIFTVETEDVYEITITDISGKVISQIPNVTNSKLDLSNQSNGIYFIKFQNNEHTETLKIIKQ